MDLSTRYQPDDQRPGLLHPWRRLARLPCAERAELLDLPNIDPAPLRGNLRDLRRVNHWLGGTRLTLRAIEHLFRPQSVGEHLSFLDVGTGTADIPIAITRWARQHGWQPRVVASDRNPTIVQLASEQAPLLLLTVADGTQLPFATNSFDIVGCSLLLHHLDPPDAVALLSEMGRVGRHGVIINDLVRSRSGYLGAWLVAHLTTRNPLTRHDAPLSVRRAYTLPEITELFEHAALRLSSVETFLGYRVAITAVAL